MKKFLFALMALLSSLNAYALPTGNPADPCLYRSGVFFDEVGLPFLMWNAIDLRLGYYGDYVFDRHLQTNEHVIDETSLNTNAALIVVNFWNCVDLFGTVGATHLHISTPSSAFVSGIFSDNSMFDVDTPTALSYSIGIRGAIWDCYGLYLGGGFQYFAVDPDVSSVNSDYYSNSVGYVNGIELKYREWQVSVGCAYPFCFAPFLQAIPYVDIVWSHVSVSGGESFVLPGLNPETVDLVDMNSQHHFGYAVGMTLVGSERASLNIEGRFADEKALCFNIQFRL